jgi:hypothetical protein
MGNLATEDKLGQEDSEANEVGLEVKDFPDRRATLANLVHRDQSAPPDKTDLRVNVVSPEKPDSLESRVKME